jgi:Na+/H+ antiporter NhaD/arsenite permease-like protein
MNEREAIRVERLLSWPLVVVALTMVGLLFHSALHPEAATIALLGATVLMLVGRLHVDTPSAKSSGRRSSSLWGSA